MLNLRGRHTHSPTSNSGTRRKVWTKLHCPYVLKFKEMKEIQWGGISQQKVNFDIMHLAYGKAFIPPMHNFSALKEFHLSHRYILPYVYEFNLVVSPWWGLLQSSFFPALYIQSIWAPIFSLVPHFCTAELNWVTFQSQRPYALYEQAFPGLWHCDCFHCLL